MKLYIAIAKNQILTIGIANILADNGFIPIQSTSIEGEGVFIVDDSQLESRIFHPNQYIVLVVRVVGSRSIYMITKSGLNGCIESRDSPEHLLMTVRHMLQGKSYFAPRVLKMLFQKDTIELGERLYCLTDRELEVLRLTARGIDNGALAGILKISIRTVNAHKRKVLLRTKLHSMEELIARAYDYGIIS